MYQVVISGTGLYHPEEAISNEELVYAFNCYVHAFNQQHRAAIAAGQISALAESSAEFILKASGIKSRYVINKAGLLDPQQLQPLVPERMDSEYSVQCEMAVAAAKQALAAAGKRAVDIDMVIVACSSMQRPYPAVAIEVQEALGITGYGYDLNVACASASFGIQAATAAIQTGQARCVLMVNPEICTAQINFRDRDSHFIFGDASTAVVLERLEDCQAEVAFEVLSTRLQTQFSNNIRNNFGFMNRTAPETVNAQDKLFVQQGRQVFREVIPWVVQLISKHLSLHDLSAQQLKRLWLHQANVNMNRLITEKLLGYEPDAEQAPVILDEYANTSAAGAIIAFHLFHQDLVIGDLGLLSSFGAGYSAGSVLLKRVR